MLIQVQDIRAYRPIAANIEQSRVEVYIKECEQLDIQKAIGADEYEHLSQTPATQWTIEEQTLFNGGVWEDANDVKHVFAGLKAAECYLAYARFVRNHPAQVTPFGVVVKDGEDSTAASSQMIASIARDAEQVGKQYLNDAVEYWRAQTAQNCERRKTGGAANLPRYKAIGE